MVSGNMQGREEVMIPRINEQDLMHNINHSSAGAAGLKTPNDAAAAHHSEDKFAPRQEAQYVEESETEGVLEICRIAQRCLRAFP